MKDKILSVILCLIILAAAVAFVGLLSGSFVIGLVVVAFYAALQGIQDYCR